MDWLRDSFIVAAVVGGAWGALVWWRYRRQVVELLGAILDELRRRGP